MLGLQQGALSTIATGAQQQPPQPEQAQQPTRAALREAGSRHRYRYEPPPTPEGFWDMGFMDSLVTQAFFKAAPSGNTIASFGPHAAME